jgi:hypothetical protein
MEILECGSLTPLSLGAARRAENGARCHGHSATTSRRIKGVKDIDVDLVDGVDKVDDQTRIRAMIGAVVVCLGLAAQPALGAVGDPVAGERGFVYLFDDKTTDGWTQSGPGGFRLKADGSLESQGGMGLLWFSRRLYTDFVLRLDYRVSDRHSNSGVFVRFPNPPRTPWDAVDQGFEVQIVNAGVSAGRGTGHIYGFQKAQPFQPNPPSQWNQMELTAVGRDYIVKINGQIVCEFTDRELRGLKGYIGIQNHTHDSPPVSFRNIRIREIKPSLDGRGFIHLFSGTDLAGWEYGPKGTGQFTLESWKASKVLRSQGGMGVLAYMARTFSDCVLVVEWRVRRREDNSGVFIRSPEIPLTEKAFWRAVYHGHEVQICDAAASPTRRTGAIFDIAPATKSASHPPGIWNRFEITMVGQDYAVNLNGEDVCRYTSDRTRSGYIALQAHDPESIVEFRTIMVKDLAGK